MVTIVAEGDYVVLAFVTEYPEPDGSGTYTSTHFDMFRIENGVIAEHWDSIQIRPDRTRHPLAMADLFLWSAPGGCTTGHAVQR